MRKKYLYLETYGCQMNEYDSDRIRNALGLDITEDPDEADVVIINTCAIRDKADHKAFSSLGRFKHLKANNPGAIVGVAGCVAQLYEGELLERIPHLDFVLGPRSIPKLPRLISRIEKDRRRKVETSFDVEKVFEIEPYHEEGKVTAFVSIQQGCNKRCAYCIVPHVRGEELNRPLADILSEGENLVDKGVREITLIGQTVNSWKRDGYKFGDLLRILAEIEGLERIRFTTSYPRDVSKKMIEAMRDVPKVCRHIHLPVQSGSNRVLSLMERTYRREWFIDRVNRLRDSIPDIGISTDVIVGFPGETEEDFKDTMTLLEDVEFDSSFSFTFSPRPGTPAAGLEETEGVDDGTARRRLAEFQELQRKISLKKNRERVGEVEDVLIEGESKNDPNWVSGRTTHNRIVNLPGNGELIGKLVKVEIEEGLPNSLRGKLA